MRSEKAVAGARFRKNNRQKNWRLADARNAVFCRTKSVPEDRWGSFFRGASKHAGWNRDQGCHSDLSADYLTFRTGDFPFLISFWKVLQKLSFFLLWRRDPVVELQFLTPLRVVLLCVRSSAAICDILARTPIVFCSSVCADRIVRAASRLRGAAAAP